jgi:hypothetical protein
MNSSGPHIRYGPERPGRPDIKKLKTNTLDLRAANHFVGVCGSPHILCPERTTISIALEMESIALAAR